MLKLHDIGRVHIELTTRCNARCPMCPRNLRGYDYNSGYPITELSINDFKKIFTPDFFKRLVHNANRERFFDQPEWNEIDFNGNLGDFASARDGVEIVEYCVEHGLKVSICTNGSVRKPEWWKRLALPGVEIGFDLDGLADTHAIYRQDTDWHRIIENAQAFIAAGGNAVWRFIPFEHNRHQEQQCRELSEKLGFSRFERIYDGRDSGPVFNRDGSYKGFIGEKAGFYPPEPVPIKWIKESHVHWFDSKNVRSDNDHPDTTIFCQHKKRKEIYVAADGSVYPCCYLGFYPTQMQAAGNDQIKKLVKENNALEYGLEHALSWFDAIEETWKQSSIKEGRLYRCVHHCGKLPK